MRGIIFEWLFVECKFKSCNTKKQLGSHWVVIWGVFMLKYNRDCFALLQVQDSNKAALSEGLSQSLKENSETLLLYPIMYYFELFWDAGEQSQPMWLACAAESAPWRAPHHTGRSKGPIEFIFSRSNLLRHHYIHVKLEVVWFEYNIPNR